MTPRCALCDGEDAYSDFRVGRECSRRLGLRMLSPPRRPAVPCTRCNGMVFVRVLPRVYSRFNAYMTPSAFVSEQHTFGAPMTLTAKPPPVAKHVVADPEPLVDGLGTVETYVCKGCGFVEWYCQDPDKMPIGDEYNTQLVDYSSAGPYR